MFVILSGPFTMNILHVRRRPRQVIIPPARLYQGNDFRRKLVFPPPLWRTHQKVVLPFFHSIPVTPNSCDKAPVNPERALHNPVRDALHCLRNKSTQGPPKPTILLRCSQVAKSLLDVIPKRFRPIFRKPAVTVLPLLNAVALRHHGI
eukprot:jgi/Mesvir1/10568/Mv25988-RA.1